MVLVQGPAPHNSRVFCLEDDEQDVQGDIEAQEKEEEEQPKEEQQERREEEEEEEADEQDVMKVLGNLVVALFIKYWIYVCGGMFFFVSFEGKIVMYKIIYMVLFLFCVALYQVGACGRQVAILTSVQGYDWASFGEALSYCDLTDTSCKGVDEIQTL